MMSTSNVLTTELHDFLYNQCIDNAGWYSIFIFTHGSDKGMQDKIFQHWWKSWKTLSGMQEKMCIWW